MEYVGSCWIVLDKLLDVASGNDTGGTHVGEYRFTLDCSVYDGATSRLGWSLLRDKYCLVFWRWVSDVMNDGAFLTKFCFSLSISAPCRLWEFKSRGV